ncbi:hypothetical protein BZA77DRAFT_67238 [Pyronema omphalodes]|nr:hypothetical protein BZA77DRAFT_67238 [Pyronema omphalodes]
MYIENSPGIRSATFPPLTPPHTQNPLNVVNTMYATYEMSVKCLGDAWEMLGKCQANVRSDYLFEDKKIFTKLPLLPSTHQGGISYQTIQQRTDRSEKTEGGGGCGGVVQGGWGSKVLFYLHRIDPGSPGSPGCYLGKKKWLASWLMGWLLGWLLAWVCLLWEISFGGGGNRSLDGIG